MTAQDVVNYYDGARTMLLKGLNKPNDELRADVLRTIDMLTPPTKELVTFCLAGTTLRPGRMG